MLVDILIKKPDDCLEFMIQWLEKRKDFLKPSSQRQ